MAELVKDQMLEDGMAKDIMVEDEVDITLTKGSQDSSIVPPDCMQIYKPMSFLRRASGHHTD